MCVSVCAAPMYFRNSLCRLHITVTCAGTYFQGLAQAIIIVDDHTGVLLPYIFAHAAAITTSRSKVSFACTVRAAMLIERHLYMYIYTCMYMYMYMYMYKCTCTCTCTCICICTCICTCMWICICTCICTSICICICIWSGHSWSTYRHIATGQYRNTYICKRIYIYIYIHATDSTGFLLFVPSSSTPAVSTGAGSPSQGSVSTMSGLLVLGSAHGKECNEYLNKGRNKPTGSACHLYTHVHICIYMCAYICTCVYIYIQM